MNQEKTKSESPRFADNDDELTDEVREDYEDHIVHAYLYPAYVYNRASTVYFWLNIGLFTVPMALDALLVTVCNNIPIKGINNTEGIAYFETQEQKHAAIHILGGILLFLQGLQLALKLPTESALYGSNAKKSFLAYLKLKAKLKQLISEKSRSKFITTMNKEIKESSEVIDMQKIETPLPMSLFWQQYTKPSSSERRCKFENEIKNRCFCHPFQSEQAANNNQNVLNNFGMTQPMIVDLTVGKKKPVVETSTEEVSETLRQKYTSIATDYLADAIAFNHMATILFWTNICVFVIPIGLKVIFVIVIRSIPVQNIDKTTGMAYFINPEQKKAAINVLPVIGIFLLAMKEAVNLEKQTALCLSVAKKAFYVYNSLIKELHLQRATKLRVDFTNSMNKILGSHSVLVDLQKDEVRIPMMLLGMILKNPHSFMERTDSKRDGCCRTNNNSTQVNPLA